MNLITDAMLTPEYHQRKLAVEFAETEYARCAEALRGLHNGDARDGLSARLGALDVHCRAACLRGDTTPEDLFTRIDALGAAHNLAMRHLVAQIAQAQADTARLRRRFAA